VGDEAPIVLIARNAATQVSPVASIKQSPFATHGSGDIFDFNRGRVCRKVMVLNPGELLHNYLDRERSASFPSCVGLGCITHKSSVSGIFRASRPNPFALVVAVRQSLVNAEFGDVLDRLKQSVHEDVSLKEASFDTVQRFVTHG
jgi:hypothetical protein